MDERIVILKMESLIAALVWYYAQIALGRNDPAFIKDYIGTEAIAAGVNPQMMQGLADKESRFHCEAIGDHGDSHGCFQINKPTQKKVRPLSVEQAHDVIVSTNWSIQTIKEDGSCRQWSTCGAVMKELVRDD